MALQFAWDIMSCEDSGIDAGHTSEENLDKALETVADDADVGFLGQLVGRVEVPWGTDPVERFWVASKWVSQVRHFQHNLRRGVKQPLETIKARQAALMKRQQDRFLGRVKKTLTKLRSAKVSQHRHIVCFIASTADVMIHAFWTGYSPMTVHHWYTFKMVQLIFARFAFYRYKRQHFYLVDMCYYSNFVTLVYLWFLRDRPWMFQAAYSYSGMMLFSVMAFRNSFVPHCLDRMTSLHVHLDPVLQMWVIRWQSEGLAQKGFSTSNEIGLYYAYAVYGLWALTYSLFMFVFDISKVKEGKHPSLYTLLAYDYGCYKAIPAWSRPFAPVMFMTGHVMLFSTTGLFYLALPFEAQTVCILLCILVAIKNGATFYMTYFWKVYEKQIHEAERQMAKAQAAMEKSDNLPHGGPEEAKSAVAGKEPMADDVEEDISESSEDDGEDFAPPRRPRRTRGKTC